MDSSRVQIKVLVLIYELFDTLDFAVPLDIFGETRISDGGQTWSDTGNRVFETTIAAADELTTSTEGNISAPIHQRHELKAWLGAAIKRHISLAEAHKRLSEFDILVVPGGRPVAIQHLCTENGLFVQMFVSFVELPKKQNGKERVLLSICNGALFLGAAGALAGKKATTHYAQLKLLENICAGQAGASTEIVRARFVDCGVDEKSGMRLMTAGGLSCSLDACLRVVELRTNRKVAEDVAHYLEYAWRRDEGVLE